MSGPRRIDAGGTAIRRDAPLAFSFDGRGMCGLAGDTIASALLANGVRVVARSFKYHRPRGIVAAGCEEPNAVVDLRVGERHDPNARATLEPLVDGMVLRSVHARGTAARDRLAVLDRLHRFIPAAFYYKTFKWPRWDTYEPTIRALAGLGRLDGAARASAASARHVDVDVCVVGAGAAGLGAATRALRAGRRVLVLEQQTTVGGATGWRDATIDGIPGTEWAAARLDELRSGGATVLTRATALATYDHGSVVAVERGLDPAASPNGERAWIVRAGEIVLATGALGRPLVFEDNDRPGVMLADAALAYLRRYGVRAGERAVVATIDDSAYEVADALVAAGAGCEIVDSRPAGALAQRARDAGIVVHDGDRVAVALGRSVVEGVRLASGRAIKADLVAVSGGWTPQIHLYCHAHGRPRWDAALGAFVPGTPVERLSVVGAAAGELPAGWGGPPVLPAATGRRRAWVDLQHDVTTKDIDLAVRENYASVEHLKRYTTLGMAADQGKTSGVNGIALLAARTGREVGAVGVTTFRPPYVPASFATLAGRERGELQSPVARWPLESVHREEGAHLRDYGPVLRPAWYGPEAGALERECRAARERSVVFDASSLGKIEVIGPDASRLLDFIYYQRMSTLAPGRARYGITLGEGGTVFDDGVVLCLAPGHYVVSCSSSHVTAMLAHLEEWREDHHDLRRVFVHDATAQWAMLAISGPGSRAVMSALALEVDLDDAAFPHMHVRDGRWAGRPARIARVSFTGERCYEVSVPASLGSSLWRAARAAGAEPLGLEALGLLRMEKGYLFIGQDTDGDTQPQDLGITGPRDARTDAYVGDRSLALPAARRPGRRQFVGVAAEGHEPIPVGAHAVVKHEGRWRSAGFVTSSGPSVALGRPVALALIEDGRSRLGESFEFDHFGRRLQGTLVAPCFLDPEGARLNG
ncbi:MAG: 2Fe-2S iron-sulfur cluster-binding protein [Steroidobacteraceae bacterium]